MILIVIFFSSALLCVNLFWLHHNLMKYSGQMLSFRFYNGGHWYLEMLNDLFEVTVYLLFYPTLWWRLSTPCFPLTSSIFLFTWMLKTFHWLEYFNFYNNRMEFDLLNWPLWKLMKNLAAWETWDERFFQVFYTL